MMILLLFVLTAVTVSPEGVTVITAESTMEELVEMFGEENLETTREHLGEALRRAQCSYARAVCALRRFS